MGYGKLLSCKERAEKSMGTSKRRVSDNHAVLSTYNDGKESSRRLSVFSSI